MQLFAVQTYERTRLTDTLFFTEWEDAILSAVHTEPLDAPGFDYTLITEFDVDEELLEDIRMNDTETLIELMQKSVIINQQYFN